MDRFSDPKRRFAFISKGGRFDQLLQRYRTACMKSSRVNTWGGWFNTEAHQRRVRHTDAVRQHLFWFIRTKITDIKLWDFVEDAAGNDILLYVVEE